MRSKIKVTRSGSGQARSWVKNAHSTFTFSIVSRMYTNGTISIDFILLQGDDKFPPSSRIIQEGGNLTILNLGKEDHGSYECVATNIVTSVITTTLLIIECKYVPMTTNIVTRVITTTLLIIECKYVPMAPT